MINYGEKLTAEEAEEMCKEADIDGNGLIPYRKFVAVIAGAKWKNIYFKNILYNILKTNIYYILLKFSLFLNYSI